jgi:3-deoxy-7-phosphoheptulonate synthase
MLQIGARNMYNTELLKAVGRLDKPVLLKRGFMATLDELLLAAEYIAGTGQFAHRPVRARHPHVRDADPQHPRHRRDPAASSSRPRCP